MLITGASGFLGRAIVEALEPGASIYACQRSPWSSSTREVPTLELDLLSPGASRECVDRIRPEVIVHAAWHTAAGSYSDDDANVHWLRASKALLEAFAQSGGRRFIAIGSCAEYLPPLGETCSEQRTPADGMSAYGRAKAALARCLADLCSRGALETAHARLFFLYGPNEKPTRLVPTLVSHLLRGEPVELGPGDNVRDFMHVEDAGRAIARLATSQIVGPINIASGIPTRIRDIAHHLGERARRPDLIRLDARPPRSHEPARLVADVTRQTVELGFRPRVGLEEGLHALFDAQHSRTKQGRVSDAYRSSIPGLSC